MRQLLPLLLLASLALAEDEAVHSLARAEEGLSNFDFGYPRALFRSALEHFPARSVEARRAAFGLATCLHHGQPLTAAALAQARALFTELSGGQDLIAARSTMALGRIAELRDLITDLPDLPQARLHYQDALARFPDHEVAGEATFRIAGTYLQELTPEATRTGIELLRAWLAGRPDEPLAGAMWQYLGDAEWYRRGDARAALDCYEQADAVGLQNVGKEGQLWWRMARLAELEVKDRDRAVRWYTRICERAQTSGKAFEAQMALARLGAPIPELTAFAAYTGPRPPLPAPTATGAAP